MTAYQQIAHIADVPVEVEAELDLKVMTIAQILELSAGSVIRMTRSAGENIEIHVGGSVIGFGEIVIIEDVVGVRITDFCSED